MLESIYSKEHDILTVIIEDVPHYHDYIPQLEFNEITFIRADDDDRVIGFQIDGVYRRLLKLKENN